MRAFNRRNVLLGVGAAGVAGWVGLDLAAAEGPTVRAIVTRLVGPFRMKDQQFEALVSGLKTYRGNWGDVRLAGYRALSLADVHSLPVQVPGRFQDVYDKYERKVLTRFLIDTNYLKLRNPATEWTEMTGTEICRSPFANFEVEATPGSTAGRGVTPT